MAAGRIKGITVEIGGDTTKLQTALKGGNSEIKNTQAQLKDVEKLLKLDPGNTELLAQKQKLLSDAVSETKDTAKAEVDKPFPQEVELSEKLERLAELNALLNMDEKGDDAIGMDDDVSEPEKPQENEKLVDKKGDEVADMPAKQSNLGKTVTDNNLSDRPAERTSLQEKLAAMKARVSGTPAGRDAAEKAKGKDQIL